MKTRTGSTRRQRHHGRQGPDGRAEGRILEVRPQRLGRQDEAQEPSFRQPRRRPSTAPTRSSTPSSSTRRKSTYSYFADPMYVFMDGEFNQFDVEKENLGDALNYLEDGLACELTFYEGRAISVELPTLGGPRDRLHRAGGEGRHVGQGDEAREARQRLRGAGPAVRHAPATGSRSTPAPASTAAASDPFSCLQKGRPRAPFRLVNIPHSTRRTHAAARGAGNR